MKTSMKEINVTTGHIAKELGMKETMVSNKIKAIFDKYGFKEEDKKMYMSKSRNGRTGKYIFSNINAVKKLFAVYDSNRFITAQERDNLIECLIECLPIFRETADYKKLNEINAKENAVKNTKLSDSQFKWDDLYLKINRSDEHKADIVRIIMKYYIAQITNEWEFFKERIFVSVELAEPKRSVRAEMYKYQYGLMLEWSEKWLDIMNTVNRIRNAEKFENEYKNGKYKKNGRKTSVEDRLLDDCLKEESWMAIDDLYEYILYEYEGKLPRNHEDIEKKIFREECYEMCFEEVKKILGHSLKKDFLSDFEYLIEKAFEELQMIRKCVIEREKRECYCLFGEKRNMADFDELYKVRNAIARKKRLITDYK